jgi:hypothetical protein
VSDTVALVEEQVRDLTPLVRLFGRDLHSSREHRDVATVHGHTSPTYLRLARRILTIYEPGLGDRLDGVLDEKNDFLRDLDTILRREFEGLYEPKAVIRDIGGIDYRFADTTAVARLRLAEFQEIDIANEEAVRAYVGRARDRLQELSMARQSLAKLIREQFDVEDLL